MAHNDNDMKFETLAIHAGTPADPTTGARSMPIHQAVSFKFKSAEHAANLFALKEAGYIYSRLTNPTVAALEERLAALEGGVGATCTPTGIAANLLAFYGLMSAGDEFISSCKIYGASTSQFRDTFKRAFNWGCHFVDPLDPDNFKRALTEKTKLIFVESVSNPEGVVADLEAIARVAEDAGIPLIVDNTVPTPYLCRPFEHGAAIITHSTTKYLSGHGQALGGAVVDGGTFDWTKYPDKFPALAGPEPSYHGKIFAEAFDAPVAMHNHAVGLRDLGLSQQPMNAYLTLLGMETLGLRMQRHCENAQKVAEFLESHPQVAWVNYCGLDSSPYKDLAQKYLRNGWGSSLFTFGVKGGYEAAKHIVENVQIFSHVANIGDTRSLIVHPASTTHSELTEEQKIAAGALPESLRLSIGLEHIDDIIADLDQALKHSQAMAA